MQEIVPNTKATSMAVWTGGSRVDLEVSYIAVWTGGIRVDFKVSHIAVWAGGIRVDRCASCKDT